LALETVLSSVVPRNGKVLVIRNGVDGARIAQIANVCITLSKLMFQVHKIEVVEMDLPEDQPVDVEAIREKLSTTEGITHFAMVHGETSNGMLLPWPKIVELVSSNGCSA
jgi:2-aminoethylphosphonate-pyruvate transaminase